jgi:hypothetical protein
MTLVLVLISQPACLPLGPPNAVNVIQKAKDLELKGKKAVVPDFFVPEHGAGLGPAFSDLLVNVLLSENIFQSVSRDLPVVWTHPGETLDLRLADLSRLAVQKGFDYVWVGMVDQLFYGGLVDSTLAVTLRLVDARSGAILFMASNKQVSVARDPSYPLDTKLTKPADAPLLLAEKLLRQIVSRLL